MASCQSFGTSPFSHTYYSIHNYCNVIASKTKNLREEPIFPSGSTKVKFGDGCLVSHSVNRPWAFVVSFQELQGLLGISCLTAQKNVLSTCWRFFPVVLWTSLPSLDLSGVILAVLGPNACFVKLWSSLLFFMSAAAYISAARLDHQVSCMERSLR